MLQNIQTYNKRSSIIHRAGQPPPPPPGHRLVFCIFLVYICIYLYICWYMFVYLILICVKCVLIVYQFVSNICMNLYLKCQKSVSRQSAHRIRHLCHQHQCKIRLSLPKLANWAYQNYKNLQIELTKITKLTQDLHSLVDLLHLLRFI